MPQQFITQLEQVCRRRGRRHWLTATCWAFVSLLLTALVLIGLDRALGIADPWGRGLLTLAFVVLCMTIIRRWFEVVAKVPMTPLQIAHEVERQHPTLRDVVANASEFVDQADDDPTAGSESLRRAIVLRAATADDDIDWQRLIPREPLRRAAFALVGMGLMISLLAWCFPQALEIGLSRLVNPLNMVEWPREHDLQFVEPPTLLASGDDLVLQLRNTRGELPASITMHYRTRRQGRWHEETQSLAATPGALKIRRSSVQESLQFRATGADHQTMPWQSLEVVAPPRVEQLQITVHSPSYTRLPSRLWDKSTPIYSGSDLELLGQTDQPVTEVVLVGEKGRRLRAHIGAEGQSFSLERSDWRVESSETYTLQLTTAAGLTTRAVNELVMEVVVDRSPQVRFVVPTNDLTVLSTVTVPLVIEASDELAVRDIELVYSRSDRQDEGKQRLQLWHAGDEKVVVEQQVDFLWQLESLSLQPGCVIEVHAHATDYQSVRGQPVIGQTVRTLRLNVVSEDELWHQILKQQARLVETLTQLLNEQRELRGITTDWAEFPEWTTARWASASHAALFRQRQIADSLAGNQYSVLGQLASLMETIERNRLMRPEAVDRLQTAQEVLQNLIDDPLAAVEQSLGEITRQSQRLPEQKNLLPWVAAISEHQEQVVAGLRRAIDLLTPGNVLGQLERELALLETDQQDLAERCREVIAPQMIQVEDIKPELETTLASAIRQQRELARRLAELVLNMAQAAERLSNDEPVLAERVAGTVTLAEELDTQATIQAAADQLARRRFGRSVNRQRQTLEDLAKLRLRLAGQDAKEGADRFKSLQAAERQLRRLRNEVAALERELRQLDPQQRQRDVERLRRQREKLAAQTEAIARKLERLRVPAAAKPASEAASHLRRPRLDSENTRKSQQQLATAQRQLTDARRRQQVALARLEMARLDAKLGSFVARQQTIQQEILQLNELRTESGQLSKAEEQSVLQLADRQAGLRDEVLTQADRLTTLPVFAHLLKMVGETMQSVEDRLQQMELTKPTLTLADQAVRQLTQLTTALRQERKNLANNRAESDSKSGAGQGQTGDRPQAQTLQLALGQLRLLKSLQEDLRQKTQTLETQALETQALETQQTTDQPTNNLASELARQQQQLTELARQLISEPPGQENQP